MGEHPMTTVFIVEDEALIAMELRDRLTKLGYDVCGHALRGEAAIEPILSSQPDVVLMDIHLAGQLDGIETARRLRGQIDCAVIFVTAYSDDALLHKAGEVDPYAYLVKPFQERDLHTTIQMALRRRQLELDLREANERLEERVRQRTAELGTSQGILAGIVANLEGAVLCRMTFSPAGAPRCHYVSPNVAEVLGVSAVDFMADPNVALQYLTPEDEQAVLASREAMIRTGGPAAVTFRLQLPGEGERWVSVRSRLSHWLADGSQVRDGVFVDVTALKAAEASARSSEEQVERKRETLAALRRVQEAFIADPEGPAAFDDLLTTLLASTDSEYGLIGEVARDDQGAPFLRLHAASARDGSEAARQYIDAHMPDGHEFHNLESLLGAVVLDDRPVIANDVPSDPRSRGVCAGHPALHSFMGVPVVVAGTTIGMLGVANREAGYDQAVLDGLQPLVATCGSLLVANRNEQRRRAAEEALRALNANLETEVQRRAAALADSERTFASLATSSPVGIFRTDAAGACVSVNDRWCSLTGLSEAEARGAGWARTLHPGDRDRVLAEWEAIAESGGEFKSEYRFRRPDGETTWVLGQAVPVQDVSGAVTGYIGTTTDVTEQKQAERALRMLSTDRAVLEGEAFYRSVVTNLASLLECDGAFIARRLPDSSGRFQVVAAIEDGEVSGPHAFDPAGRPCAEPLDGRPYLVATGLRDRYPRDAHFAAKGYDSYLAVPIFDHRGAAIGNVAVVSRHRLIHPASIESLLSIFAVAVSAEMTRERGARRFHDLVEFASDSIVMVDQKGVIALVNRQTEELFGWNREQLIGQPVEILIPVELRSRHVAERRAFDRQASRRSMGPGRTGLQARRKDGTELPVEISLNPIETEDGTMVVAAIRDITERLRLEQQARRAQRMEAIGTLAGGIAHDLNNALAPITMALSMLRLQPQNERLIDTMERSALRAVGMVRQLLSFARGAEGNRAPVDTAHLVAEIEAIIRPTFPKNITITAQIHAAGTTVLGDATQLHQVLLNLCVNARDAVPHGGDLTLTVAEAEISSDALPDTTARPGRYVVLHISDTGVGIPPDTLDRIFDPFFTTKGPDKGSGLGLSIVASIIKGHGGFVLVSSQIGRGTTFSVYLPSHADADQAPAPESPAVFDGRGETILLVDDEPVVREVGVQLLTQMGLKPLIAADGAEALSQVARFASQIRVVLTDLHMPSMDGLAFVSALRHLMPEVPVIVSSGHLGDTAPAFRDLGVTLILDKPFTQEKLARVLQAALTRPQP